MLARLLALLLTLAAAGSALLAAAVAPPLLGRFVRADGPLRGGKAQLLGWLAAALLLAAAVGAWRLARGVARRGGDPRLRRGIVVAVLAFAAGALALEAVARFVTLDPQRALDLCLPESEAWRARWHLATPPATELHRPHALLGWEPIPGHRGDGITINSAGARDRDELPAAKPAGERRLLVVGDSFAFGDGVRDEEVWCEALERQLGAARRVVNFGVMGYGLGQQVLRLEERLPSAAADVVLLALFGPDLDRDALAFRDGPKPRFALESGALVVTPPLLLPADAPRGLAMEQLPERIGLRWPRSRAAALLRHGLHDLVDTTRFAPKRELATRLLDRARASAETAGARFALAYFPAKAVSFDAHPDADEQLLVAWAAARGVPLANVRPAFHARGSALFRQVWAGHWTPMGNELVGTIVAEALAREESLWK